MLERQLKIAFACAALGFGTAAVGQFARPKPEVFARADDQARARLFERPCTAADVGRGCYRYDGRALREIPCTYHIDARTIGSLPTDQCYKMDAPRRYRGIWVDEFEGQAFIAKGTVAPEWPRGDPRAPGWREQAERARAATNWLDVSRVHLRHVFQQGGRKMLIEFVGRKTAFPGNYGHLGMSGNEIIVDRLISLRECPSAGGCG